MQIKDIPEFKDKGQVYTMSKTSSVFEAVKTMKSKKLGSIIIVDKNDKLEGIFTERDLLNKVVAPEKSPKSIKLSDVMTKNVKTALVTDNVTDSIRRMSQGRFRHLPVLNEDNTIAGVVSQGDFVAYTWTHVVQNIARDSFLGNTHVWILVLAILAYVTFAIWMFS